MACRLTSRRPRRSTRRRRTPACRQRAAAVRDFFDRPQVVQRPEAVESFEVSSPRCSEKARARPVVSTAGERPRALTGFSRARAGAAEGRARRNRHPANDLPRSAGRAPHRGRVQVGEGPWRGPPDHAWRVGLPRRRAGDRAPASLFDLEDRGSGGIPLRGRSGGGTSRPKRERGERVTRHRDRGTTGILSKRSTRAAPACCTGGAIALRFSASSAAAWNGSRSSHEIANPDRSSCAPRTECPRRRSCCDLTAGCAFGQRRSPTR